jgi:hypothetical protein
MDAPWLGVLAEPGSVDDRKATGAMPAECASVHRWPLGKRATAGDPLRGRTNIPKRNVTRRAVPDFRWVVLDEDDPEQRR